MTIFPILIVAVTLIAYYALDMIVYCIAEPRKVRNWLIAAILILIGGFLAGVASR